MSYLASWNAAVGNTDFIHTVEVACCKSAVNVQAEVTTTPNHTNRANYAKLILNAPDVYGPLFAKAICSNDQTITTASADATVQTACDSVFNALAGTI